MEDPIRHAPEQEATGSRETTRTDHDQVRLLLLDELHHPVDRVSFEEVGVDLRDAFREKPFLEGPETLPRLLDERGVGFPDRDRNSERRRDHGDHGHDRELRAEELRQAHRLIERRLGDFQHVVGHEDRPE